ncbi:MAG: ATP-binding cassette domain-containing protein [Alphaproteobacteria bacterium]|nr:ATP-binding cassette domain-containing protein [Alphaproteobacteria bacterium]
MSEAPLLIVDDLKVHFPVPQPGLFSAPRPLKAVDGVSFTLASGETLGVVGESGCGKSTLGRAILRLIPTTAGRAIFAGEELTALSEAQMRPRRRDLQIIFQDPLASLDPRMTVGDIIAEPLQSFLPELDAAQRRAKVSAMMNRVGLSPQMISRYPHEFSGGQAQRIGIARAMILEPKLIVCDEPVSALDVSIRAQILNLLSDLQRDFGLSLLFISHDLAVVRHVSHRVLVLYLGKIMELAETETLNRRPRHPYTRALLSAAPIPDPSLERDKERLMIGDDLPSPLDPPSGCVFRTRCPKAAEKCAHEVPALAARGAEDGSVVACHFPD